MRVVASLVLGSIFLFACGQLAPPSSDPEPAKNGSDPVSQDPGTAAGGAAASTGAAAGPGGDSSSGSGSGSSSGGAPSGAGSAGTCGTASTTVQGFASTDAAAVALHGLWSPCNASPPTVCPDTDATILLGDVDMRDDASRVASCGHMTTHGDGFIANPQYAFTYDVEIADVTASAPSYVLHLWGASFDRTFAITYRSDAQSGPSEDSLALDIPDAESVLRRTFFTTF